MIYVCEYGNTVNKKEQRKCGLTGGSYEQQEREVPGQSYEQQAARLSEKNHERQTARRLLDFALKREFGVSIEELDWKLGANGKPYSGRYPWIHFNISHCVSACACAVGLQETGIDIERLFDYREPLAKKVSHGSELDRLEAMNPEEREQQLRYLWSLKESFVKWNGRGLGYGIDRISFARQLPFELENGQQLSFEWQLLEGQRERHIFAEKLLEGQGERHTFAEKLSERQEESLPEEQESRTKIEKQSDKNMSMPVTADDAGAGLKFLLYRGASYTLCACAGDFDFTVNHISEEELYHGKADKTEV